MSISGDELSHYLVYSSIGHIFFIIIARAARVIKKFRRFLKSERAKLIREHRKEGHDSPLKHCREPSCQILRHL